MTFHIMLCNDQKNAPENGTALKQRVPKNVIVVVEIVNPIGFPSEFGDILIYICLTSNAQARHRPDSGD